MADGELDERAIVTETVRIVYAIGVVSPCLGTRGAGRLRCTSEL